MTDRARIIEMAEEAGMVANEDPRAINALGKSVPFAMLERFAALVRAQVIEECTVAVESAILRMLDPRQTASECLNSIRALKDQTGHSVSSVAEASTAPLPEGEAATARELAAMFRQFTKSSHRWHDGRSVHIVAAEVLEHFASQDEHSYRQQTDREYRDEIGKRIETTLKSAASICDLAPNCPCFNNHGDRIAPCWFAGASRTEGSMR